MRAKYSIIIFLWLLLRPGFILAADIVSYQNLGLIVNQADPQSIALARFYQQQRMIPAANIIFVDIDSDKANLSPVAFKKIYQQIQQQTENHIQAYALAWSKPYKVGCMSITSAFALGYDKKYCAKGCKTTATIGYYNSSSRQPYQDYVIRPTIMLAGKNLQQAKAMIKQGVDADYSHPEGTAYLLSTSDRERNVRAVAYPQIVQKISPILNVEIIKGDGIKNKKDVLFYFTGLKKVRNISGNHFLPGAVADHLTSTGGVLFNGPQMSVLEWLSAGASGSYGTVVEPCNFPGKFPNPAIMMSHYLNGETLLEAYWKSVAMPGQGLFVGEPLAAPFKGCRLQINQLGVFSFSPARPDNYVMAKNRNCGLP